MKFKKNVRWHIKYFENGQSDLGAVLLYQLRALPNCQHNCKNQSDLR